MDREPAQGADRRHRQVPRPRPGTFRRADPQLGDPRRVRGHALRLVLHRQFRRDGRGSIGRLQHYADEVYRARTGDLRPVSSGNRRHARGNRQQPGRLRPRPRARLARRPRRRGPMARGLRRVPLRPRGPGHRGRVGAPPEDRLRRRGRRHTGKRPLLAAGDARHGAQPLGQPRRSPYDPAVFAQRGRAVRRAADRFRDSETYRLDLVVVPPPGPVQRGPRRVAGECRRRREAETAPHSRMRPAGSCASARAPTGSSTPSPSTGCPPTRRRRFATGTPRREAEQPAQRDDAGHLLGRGRPERRRAPRLRLQGLVAA